MSQTNDPASSETLARTDASAATGKARALAAPEMLAIRKGLSRVARGDFGTSIDAESEDPAWQSLTKQINRAVQGAQQAIKQAEDARREAAISRDEALAAARSETRFLTNVSHEIRTPLASIRSAAEILRMYPEEPMETRIEFLDMILSGAARLTELVDQVLDLSRIQAGRVHWDYRATRVEHTVCEALQAFQPVASRLGLTIHLDLADDLPQVSADPERMKQLWTSLIDNAIKFRGASVRIEITATTSENGDGVEISIRDYGIGIRPEDQGAIFQRFCQVSQGLTDKPGGAGLGLSIAKEIITSHHGTIELESQPGQGSLFRVWLPRLRS